MLGSGRDPRPPAETAAALDPARAASHRKTCGETEGAENHPPMPRCPVCGAPAGVLEVRGGTVIYFCRDYGSCFTLK